jgi:hypothetical protein
MSLAAETRAAVRARPWLLRALRAGVVNYAAAAASLDVDGEREAIATALRRFEADLSPTAADTRDVTVRMRSGVGLVTEEKGTDDGTAEADPLLSVVGGDVAPTGGALTAITAAGDVDPRALAAVVERLAAENVVVDAAGVAGEDLVVVVPRSDGANALRTVEDALTAVPTV